MYKISKPKPWITVVIIPFLDIKMIDVLTGKEPVEKPSDVYKRLAVKPTFMINAVMYNTADGKPCTNLVDEGKRLSYGFSTFGLVTQNDGSFSFADYKTVKGCKDFAGGGPALIKNGIIAIDVDLGASFMGYNPRSAIGRTEFAFIIITIDGRQTVENIVYPGMTIKQLADYMLSMGCIDAINLDGGGSTRLLHKGVTINTPCKDRAVDTTMCFNLKEGVTEMEAAHRVYISASTQKTNIGVGQYGTEQDRMMYLSDRVAYWLKTQKGKFEVFRNMPGWTLSQTVKDCNSFACEICIDNHSNAGPVGAEGTEAFYYHQGGTVSNSYKLASLVYKRIAPLSPGKDKGVLPDDKYVTSLYFVQATKPTATLIEHMFHTNAVEVADMVANVDNYAKAEAKAICEYFGITWIEIVTPEQTVALLVKEMIKDGIVTGEELWNDVLNGKVPVNPQYLQIAFGRATSKIQ